jgi:sugar lactone lactonase YvrE
MNTKITQNIFFLCTFFYFLTGNAQLVNRALVVPKFGINAGNNTVKTYFPTSATTIVENPTYTINFSTLPNGLATNASPNCTAMFGDDLFVSLTNANQRIYRFPNYGTDPSNAIANVSQVANFSSDYVGLAFDTTGNLYVSEGSWGNTTIFKYTVASNYATRIDLGNGGITSYFANIAFDANGNLWASDYWNNRIVVIKEADLNTVSAPFRSFYTNSIAWNVGGHNENLNANLGAKVITTAFSQPEGVAFDSNGKLWVANNNDSAANAAPTLVCLTVAQQNTILAITENTSINADPNMTNSINGFSIWNLPTANPVVGGTGQLGGLQIDKAINRIYVNDENNAAGMWFDIATINLITDNYNTYKLNITSTNPGNGGIYLATGTQILGRNENQIVAASVPVYPNPSSEIFKIDTTETIKKATAFDVLGKEIPVQPTTNNQFSIEKSGLYFLKIELENGTVFNEKIIIK